MPFMISSIGSVSGARLSSGSIGSTSRCPIPSSPEASPPPETPFWAFIYIALLGYDGYQIRDQMQHTDMLNLEVTERISGLFG